MLNPALRFQFTAFQEKKMLWAVQTVYGWGVVELRKKKEKLTYGKKRSLEY